MPGDGNPDSRMSMREAILQMPTNTCCVTLVWDAGITLLTLVWDAGITLLSMREAILQMPTNLRNDVVARWSLAGATVSWFVVIPYM